MFIATAYQPTQTFDQANPDQRVRTMYLPNAGEYRSVMWNKVSPAGTILNGIVPASGIGKVIALLGLAGATYFGYRHFTKRRR